MERLSSETVFRGFAVDVCSGRFRRADGDALLELPAGTLDVEGETELECAQRELSEECDLRAESWRLLKTIYPSPGVLSEKVWIFAATGLSPAPG